MFKSVAEVSLWLTAGIVVIVAAAVTALGGAIGWAVAWAVVVSVAVRVIPILASFVVAFWPRRDERVPSLAATRLLHTIAGEVWATIKLFFFYHLFEKVITRREPEHVVPGQTPIVLVHGFYSNAGFWQRLKAELREAGWSNLFSLNLEPPFIDIDEYAGQLRARIDEACTGSGCSAAIVVAHSMGGLVARACARRDAASIRHVICLGTPHQGTVLASLVPSVPTRQMRRNSAWLRALNAAPPGALTNVYSEHDNIVVPQSSASLNGTRNIRVSGVGHLDMAFSPQLHGQIVTLLAGLQPPTST